MRPMKTWFAKLRVPIDSEAMVTLIRHPQSKLADTTLVCQYAQYGRR
jgi:hypothetical protein